LLAKSFQLLAKSRRWRKNRRFFRRRLIRLNNLLFVADKIDKKIPSMRGMTEVKEFFYMRFNKKKTEKLLGEILVDRGIIGPEQLKEALTIQMNTGGMIGEIIVKLNFANEEEIAQCISFQYGFPYLPLENCEISEEVLKLVPASVAQHYCFIPIDKIGNALTVAMANPLNAEALEDLEDITSLDIHVFVGTASDIRNAIKRCYK
jgi:type IV pilus assembly protein PilB